MKRTIFKIKRAVFHAADVCLSFIILYTIHIILLIKGIKHIYYNGYTNGYMRTHIRYLKIKAEKATGSTFADGSLRFAPMSFTRFTYEIEEIVGTDKYWSLLETFNP